MIFAEYRKASSRTAGKDLLPENRDKGLNCAAMGMCGEAGEISDIVVDILHNKSISISEEYAVNLKKESGDVLWYIGHACNVMGWAQADDVEMSEFQNYDLAKYSGDKLDGLATASIELSASCGSFIDIVKKIQHHKVDMTRDMESRMRVAVVRSLVILARIANIMGWDFSDVAQMNIDKLLKRYPAGFTKEDSLKRVDA